MNKPHEKVKFIDSWLINYCQLRKYTTFPFEELYKGPGSSGWGAGTAMGVRGFFIQNFQTHYCTDSGEDYVPVGVLLFSMRTRLQGGGG